MKTVAQQERHRHSEGQPARVIQEKYLQNTNEVLHPANLDALPRPPINIPVERSDSQTDRVRFAPCFPMFVRAFSCVVSTDRPILLKEQNSHFS